MSVSSVRAWFRSSRIRRVSTSLIRCSRRQQQSLICCCRSQAWRCCSRRISLKVEAVAVAIRSIWDARLLCLQLLSGSGLFNRNMRGRVLVKVHVIAEPLTLEVGKIAEPLTV